MTRSVAALLLALGPGCSAPDPQQEAVEALLAFPPEASTFTDPRLRSLELVRHEDRAEVLARLPIEPGMRVADVGCGLGWFTFDLARAVGPAGRVWAVDLEPEYLAIVDQRETDPAFPNPGNVTTVLGRPDALPLPPASLDLALLAHLDFHLVRPLQPEHHATFLRSVHAAIRPGGRAAVLQWLGAREGSTADDMIRNFQDAGFFLEGREDYPSHDTVLLILGRR